MKKTLALALALLMMMGLLVGCGSPAPATTSDPAPVAAAPVAEAQAEPEGFNAEGIYAKYAGVELNFIRHSGYEADWMAEKADEFYKLSGIKVNTKTLKKQENRLMFGMLTPSVLFVFLISIVPLLYTFVLSFQDYNLLKGSSNFAGIKNYIEIFQVPAMRESIWITVKYTFISVILSTLVGILLSILVNQLRVCKDIYRVVFFIPMMLSGVVVGVLWRFLFNTDMGVINHLLELLGFSRVSWASSTSAAMASIIIADVWLILLHEKNKPPGVNQTAM